VTRVEVHHGAATDVGRVRTANEDAHLAEPPVFVVADGMGGHDGGDVASAIVVEEFARLAGQSHDAHGGATAIAATFRACQQRIAAYGQEQLRSGRPRWYAGTTAVVALLVEQDGAPPWLVANLGDSRAYRVAEGRLHQVSHDHSVVQELVDSGKITEADAAVHPERHVITRALGGPGRVDADFFLLPLAATERLLLCSDGVNGMLDDAAIEAVLTGAEDPRDAAERVVAAAVEAGGRDNATAVVVDVVGGNAGGAYDAQRRRASLEEKLGALP
jgi:protein phosphatase